MRAVNVITQFSMMLSNSHEVSILKNASLDPIKVISSQIQGQEIVRFWVNCDVFNFYFLQKFKRLAVPNFFPEEKFVVG